MLQSKLHHCILTGQQLSPPVEIAPTTGTFIEYYQEAVGKVKIGLIALTELRNKQQYKNPVLAGICRNAKENNEEPPLITAEFIRNKFNGYHYPKKFKEKEAYLLKWLYEHGGDNFKPRNMVSVKDYPIGYCEDEKEFDRILENLEKNSFIEWKSMAPLLGGITIYKDILLTNYGIEEIEKELPNIPLISLVDQEITTGDSLIDKKINHAKKLFFQSPYDMISMRSACEELCHILEPLRSELKDFFLNKDIEEFFKIVNAFDIRHNKEHTLKLKYEEQVEWIFYSLLNTINSYTKLKHKYPN